MPRWPIEDVRLDELDLDLRNVRIPFRGPDEAAIAAYLVESADLLELAGDILRDGYIDNDLPVVAVENGRRIVMEGNRRIAALKAISNPSLLGRSASRLERLMHRYPDAEIPAQVRVMAAPSREAFQPLLARLHTTFPKVRWIREQQAVFYHAQLATLTPDELRARYPTAAKYIPRFLRMGEMRRVIRGLHYDDKDLEEFVKSSRLSMSSLEYAYAKPKIQQALGLVFGKDGLLPSTHVSDGQRRALMYLLGLFRDNRLDTRSPELRASSDQHDAFAEELRRLVDGSATPARLRDRVRLEQRATISRPASPVVQGRGEPTVTTPAGNLALPTKATLTLVTLGARQEAMELTQPSRASGDQIGERRGRGWPWMASPTGVLPMACDAGLRNCGVWTCASFPTPPTTFCAQYWSARSRTTT